MDVTHTRWGEFREDLRKSLRAWGVAPLLPLTSVALMSVSHIPGRWSFLALPVLLFAVGWLGSERIWYLRIFRNEAIAVGELWRMTWAFFWRFVRLGLVAMIAWSPVLILALRTTLDDPVKADRVFSTPAVWVTSAILTVVIDFALTFVTPALTFSTKRVGQALRIGFRMLRDHWPRTAFYALVPPLAIVLMLRVAEPSSLNLAGRTALSVGSVLLNLWFKGATVAFYLRRVDVGSHGAAFLQQEKVSENSTS